MVKIIGLVPDLDPALTNVADGPEYIVPDSQQCFRSAKQVVYKYLIAATCFFKAVRHTRNRPEPNYSSRIRIQITSLFKRIQSKQVEENQKNCERRHFFSVLRIRNDLFRIRIHL